MQKFSYGDSAQYKSAVNTWTSWLLCDLVAGQLRAGGARPRLARTRLDRANKRADQGLRLSGVHDRLHGGILSSSINRHDDADHPLTHAPIRECGFLSLKVASGQCPCSCICSLYSLANSIICLR